MKYLSTAWDSLVHACDSMRNRKILFISWLVIFISTLVLINNVPLNVYVISLSIVVVIWTGLMQMAMTVSNWRSHEKYIEEVVTRQLNRSREDGSI